MPAEYPDPMYENATIEALSDDDLDDIIDNRGGEDDEFPASWMLSMACELHARRHADREAVADAALAEHDREALQHIREYVAKHWSFLAIGTRPSRELALAVLDRLLGVGS